MSPERFCGHIASLAVLLLLASCDAGSGEPRFYRSPEPSLSYFSSYFARLVLVHGCVALVDGPNALDKTHRPASREAIVPLFVPGFRAERTDGGFQLITPEGDVIPVGTLVHGEGGPWPEPDPRSAPVSDPPNHTRCPGRPFQIVSMHSGWGAYDPENQLR